ncbi:hypothetical protein [Shinella sp.]|uniref:hypothetical protein n=1 Tax=Shinella sp. TaxID=1870904 RepID=UPI003D2932F0
MVPLPYALFEATETPFPLPKGCGVLVRAGDSQTKGNIVIVDTTIDLATLRYIIGSGAAAIALAGWRTGADLQRLATLLSVAEAEEGRGDGATPVLAITDGILPAPVSREGVAGKTMRLAALVWDQRALKRTLGATCALTASDEWIAPFAAARAATLLTAAVAGVPAFDSFPDLTGAALERACEHSRDEGFFGGFTVDTAQVAPIGTIYGRNR